MEIPNILQDILRVSYLMGAQEGFCAQRKSRSELWQPWVDKDDYPKDCSGKHQTKWRRERRSRLPEYSRQESRNAESSNGNSPSPENLCHANGGSNGFLSGSRVQPKETPLDMSVRQRGLPPSYAQTVNNPGYRSSYRPAVLSNGPPPPPPKEEIPAGVNRINGISMCDPIIDEHFRRSLGENYQTLYLNNNNSKDSTLAKTPQPTNAAVLPHDEAIGDLMDDTGLSVDDHFAKALGETWAKLNKKQQELKNNSSENQNLVSI
ncbi:transcription cofactor vestigial-like protein 4 isoform X3 [Harmonia axyridis]|uniref:transcription cofactor vestigial-like protein 4 isoform X3 n=1 Tax=Harmonia axyridis TaxID=115357 RepID=UPI001E276974|nr:transcription cofactor vestigial-like protein 4 isoform X3 [Harmonia axyridis]